MKGFARACGKAFKPSAHHGRLSFPSRRTFVTQTQRRRATTAAGRGLSYPIVDHYYEYVLRVANNRIDS